MNKNFDHKFWNERAAQPACMTAFEFMGGRVIITPVNPRHNDQLYMQMVKSNRRRKGERDV